MKTLKKPRVRLTPFPQDNSLLAQVMRAAEEELLKSMKRYIPAKEFLDSAYQFKTKAHRCSKCRTATILGVCPKGCR